jgi:hypothetical protein
LGETTKTYNKKEDEYEEFFHLGMFGSIEWIG